MSGGAETTATMRAWRVHQYGPPLEALQLEDVPIPEPGPNEVRVRVHAIPLNLNDLERINGGNMMVRPELPYSPGLETMGVVDACGPGAEHWQGKRVVGATKVSIGGFAEHAICPTGSVFEIPDDIPLPDAAAIFFPFHLAWNGLFERAELKAGESVLIHAAAGGSGSAAVQLAVHAGARVFATAGTDEKVQRCLDLGAHVAVNYHDNDFGEVVLAETGGRGVDVVFDNVGERVMERSMACTAYNGRYLMMGFASNKAVADEAFLVPRRIAMGNMRLCGVLMSYAGDDMVQMLKSGMGWNVLPTSVGERITKEIVELVRAGHVRPVIGHVVGFDELPSLMDALASGRTSGRAIVTVAES